MVQNSNGVAFHSTFVMCDCVQFRRGLLSHERVRRDMHASLLAIILYYFSSSGTIAFGREMYFLLRNGGRRSPPPLSY